MTWTKEEEDRLLAVFDDTVKAGYDSAVSKACTRYRQTDPSKKRDAVKRKLSRLRRARGDFDHRTSKTCEWGSKNYPDTRGMYQIRMAERIFSELDQLKDELEIA